MQRLRGVDLNLLIIFQLLYQLRNTGQVADRLGITQPAVSNALARLRKQLNDELFERTPSGFSPTPFSERIFDVVNSGLSTLETGLSNNETFDPSTSGRTFRIAMSELDEIQILPPLLRYLHQYAPNLSIQSVGDTDLNLKTKLEEGDVDIAIGFFPQLQAGFYQRGLYEEPYLCVMRDRHPMMNAEFSIRRLASYQHLIVDAPESGHSHVESVLRDAGVFKTNSLHIPSFMTAPFLVKESDLIATLPARFASLSARRLGLSVMKHPVLIEPSWGRIFWHKRFHKDLGICWLRDVIVEAFKSSSVDKYEPKDFEAVCFLDNKSGTLIKNTYGKAS